MKTDAWNIFGRFMLSAFVLMLAVVCSASTGAADARQILWQSRDQFVALEHQDSPVGGTAALNDHPVELSPDRLTALLASIEFQPAGDNKSEQLFTSQSIEALVPQLVQGFRKAASGEDVTFAIIGLHKTILGFAKSPKVTTGRAFFTGGRLNIIIGLAQKDINEREDRRLSPFTPGSRPKASEGEWALLSQPGQNEFKLIRKDWVAFGDTWRAPAVKLSAPEPTIPAPKTAPAPSEKRNSDMRSPAERLTTLNELKEKGLITEEEYRRKRLEIVDKL